MPTRCSTSWQLTVRRPERAAGLVALLLALLHLLLYPDSGTDLTAQLARASFADLAPLTPVDFSWYSGVHPYGYSLLAPVVMSTLGVAVSGLICATGSAVLFARLMRHTDRPWMAALAGAFFATANVASGRITFGLGSLAALAALVLLNRRRWAVLLAVLTGLLSPVAAAFLGLAAAVLVLRHRPGGWPLGVAATAPVAVLAVLFPGGGIQPMSPGSAVPALVVALALAAWTSDPLIRTGAVLYAGAVAFFALHDDPFGSNVLRLGLLLALPLLLASTGRRTPLLVALLSFGFLTWQLDPLLADLRSPASSPFTALNQHLRAAGAQRVEVLAEREHRESAEVVGVVALARGWARQIDVRDNPLFYRSAPLQQAEYVGWLTSHAVDRVAVPQNGSFDWGSVLEGRLLRSPVAGLTREWANGDWVVYRLTNPRPVVAAPGELLTYTRTHLEIRSAQAADLLVELRWSRWLSVTGPACVEPVGDRVRIRLRSAGSVTLTSSLRPHGHC